MKSKEIVILGSTGSIGTQTLEVIRSNEDIEKHADWVEEWMGNYSFNKDNIHDIIQDEISKVFVKVLECAGVYKRTEDGMEAFMRFVNSL